MRKDVNKETVMLNPNTHIGVQLKKARESKGYSATQAMEEYNKVVPTKKVVASVVSYYQKERRAEVSIGEICAMMKAIGVNNILIDDYGVNN